MLTTEDLGKRVIVFDTFKNKWEPCSHTLAAIDASIGFGYLNKENGSAWRWPLKFIRVLDGN